MFNYSPDWADFNIRATKLGINLVEDCPSEKWSMSDRGVLLISLGLTEKNNLPLGMNENRSLNVLKCDAKDGHLDPLELCLGAFNILEEETVTIIPLRSIEKSLDGVWHFTYL